MSVDQKPSHPFFIGTYNEVGDRILAAPLEELLEATLAEPNTWRGLILRLMMERTPIGAVEKGETSIGLHIRNALLYAEYDSLTFELAFENYGAGVWGIINDELGRITENKIYPEIFIERIGKILKYGGAPFEHFNDWTTAHRESTKLLRLCAALSLIGHWDLAGHALCALARTESAMPDDLLRTARELMLQYRNFFPSNVLLASIHSYGILPELRAAMFSILHDDHKGDEKRQLLLLSLFSFFEFPGNVTALHAVAWRMPSILPDEAISLFGRKLEHMDIELLQRRKQGYSFDYTYITMLHQAAIWQYFLNLPKERFLSMLEPEKLSFAKTLAALIRHADKKMTPELGELFHRTEHHAWEFVTNPDYMYTLLLMFSKGRTHIAGKPEWSRIKFAIQRFPAEVQRTCLEIANRLNRVERGDSSPDVGQLIRFVKTAWEAESRYNKYAFYKKELIEIRDTLGVYGRHPEAAEELTDFIAERGIRDKNRSRNSK